MSAAVEEQGFHFSKESPDPQLFSDIQILNALQNNQVEELTSMVLDSLEEKDAVEDRVKSFAAEHGINARPLSRSHSALLQVLGESLRQNLSLSQIQSDLTKLGLDSDRSDLVAGKWQSRFFVLSQAQIDSTLKVNELVDMEWRFGVTAATHELSQDGAVFLQLKLSLKRNNKTDKVLMELSLPQFFKFLQQMQAANVQLNRM